MAIILVGKEDESLVFIEQYASRITCYTSQYGSVNGVSYTANNLIGPPSRFPSYGDFPETYAPVSHHFTCHQSKIVFKCVYF